MIILKATDLNGAPVDIGMVDWGHISEATVRTGYFWRGGHSYIDSGIGRPDERYAHEMHAMLLQGFHLPSDPV